MINQTSQKQKRTRFALLVFAMSFVAITSFANQASAQNCFHLFAAQKTKKQQTQAPVDQRSQAAPQSVDPRIAAVRKQIKAAALIEDGSVISTIIPNARHPFEAKVHFDARHSTFLFHVQSIQSAKQKGTQEAEKPLSMKDIVEGAKAAQKLQAPKSKKSVSDILARARIKPPQEVRAMEMSDLYADVRAADFYAALVVQMTAKIELGKTLPIVQVTEEDGTKGFAVLYENNGRIDIIRPLHTNAIRSLIETSNVQIDFNAIKIVRAAPEGAVDRKTVSVDFGSELGFVDFQILTRGQIERRNKEQAELIQRAQPNDLVPFELVMSLQYLPDGHLAFRQGNTMIEFTSTGMDIHESGADNARAYLANNPLFNTLYELGKNRGAEPLSIGVQFEIPKAVLDDFVASARSYNGPDFNIFFNNCVQCPVGLMNEAGFDLLGPRSTAFQRFSAIMATRLVLHSKRLNKTGFFVYPNSKTSEENRSFRESIGSRLTQPSNDLSEAVETGLGMLRRSFYDVTHPKETIEYWRKVRARKQAIKNGTGAESNQATDSAPPIN